MFTPSKSSLYLSMSLTRTERMIIFVTMLLFFLIMNHLCLTFLSGLIRPRIVTPFPSAPYPPTTSGPPSKKTRIPPALRAPL